MGRGGGGRGGGDRTYERGRHERNNRRISEYWRSVEGVERGGKEEEGPFEPD